MPLVFTSAGNADAEAKTQENARVIMSARHRPILPKNPRSLVSEAPETIEPLVPGSDEAVINPLGWLRSFLAANPFYLASVALLLWGIYRVSSGGGFLRTEVQQLFFNFTALQFYEIALVGLAVLLARRLVWYDSTLLVWLENLVLIVPFMLVTQASLIDRGWIWGFCAVGAGLAVACVGALKRFLRELNLPRQLLAVGAVLLAVNATLPIVYRALQEDRMGKNITWGPAYEMNEWSWLAILPLLVACAGLLPAARATGPLLPQRRWLPVTLFASWLAGSGVHLYALSYVYTFPMRAALWAPALVVLAWTLRRRVADFLEQPTATLRAVLLLLPFPLPFLALASHNTGIALALLALNAGLYFWTAARGEHRTLSLQLGLASGVAAFVCAPTTGPVPHVESLAVGSGFTHALMGYLVLSSLISRRLEMGLVGAISVGVMLATAISGMPDSIHCAFNAALMFLLLHSLRWDDKRQSGARLLRWVAASVWALHAFGWATTGAPGWQLAEIGLGVLLTWFLVRWMRSERPPVAVAIGGAAVTLSTPSVQTLALMMTAPAGLLAVAASFVLLGAGTAVALTKHRWHPVSED